MYSDRNATMRVAKRPGSGGMHPEPIAARRPRSERDGGRVYPAPIPLGSGMPRDFFHRLLALGVLHAARLRRAVPAPTGRTGQRSAFPCQRVALHGGVGPRRAPSRNCTHARRGVQANPFMSVSPGGGSSRTRLVSRAPTARTGPHRSRRSPGFHHRLLSPAARRSSYRVSVRQTESCALITDPIPLPGDALELSQMLPGIVLIGQELQ